LDGPTKGGSIKRGPTGMDLLGEDLLQGRPTVSFENCGEDPQLSNVTLSHMVQQTSLMLIHRAGESFIANQSP